MKRSKYRKVISVLAMAVLTLMLVSCGEKAGPEASGNLTATISVSCRTILDNMDMLDPEKKDIIPEEGCVLAPTEVKFNEGDSAFDVLLKVCRDNKIHLEYMGTSAYNSSFIEGLANLYEFDCGPLSGWMYKVNDWFPNYGCSQYELKDGDVLCFEYSCDLGADIGGAYSSGTQTDK